MEYFLHFSCQVHKNQDINMIQLAFRGSFDMIEDKLLVSI